MAHMAVTGRQAHDHSNTNTTQSLLDDDCIQQDRNLVTDTCLGSTFGEDSKFDVPPYSTHGDSTEGNAFLTEEPRNKITGSCCQEKHEDSCSKQENDSAKKFERHTLSLWLASAFAIVSILIWAITCTLSYKPIQFKTYFDTSGLYTRTQYEENDWWRRVSRVGLQVLGTLSIPLTSSTCASAVVVYCQQSSIKSQPTMSLRQTLVLADKGWLDLNTWMNLCGPMRRRIRTPLLILSMLLCGICKNIPSLREPTSILIFLKLFQYLSCKERSSKPFR